MKCKNCKKEFKPTHHSQLHCKPSCRIALNFKTNIPYHLKRLERIFSKDFITDNYREDPLKPEPHRDFERSCQLQTVVRTGLYVPYQMFDDQSFIGVKNLAIKLFHCKNCTWKKPCRKDTTHKFYGIGCNSYLFNSTGREPKNATV